MAVSTASLDRDFVAPDFSLPATDGRVYSLAELKGDRGVLVVFICNHCPYVKAVRERLVRDCRELRTHGIHSAAIMSNDVDAYPEDSFDNMRAVAQQFAFPFAYGAVCTPDFFGFNRSSLLRFRGRIDAFGRAPAPPDARRELFEAMVMIAETGEGPAAQIPSMGCSIKWRT